MELVSIIETLWQRKLVVFLGLLLAVPAALSTAYRLPSMEPKSIEFGSATTQVLVDSAGTSPLLDLSADLGPLSSRADVYARLVESTPVRMAIAKEAGIPVVDLVITSRGGEGTARVAREPAAEQRANQLRDEAQANRLLFAAEPDLPVVSVFAQSATAEGAMKLANAGAQGLIGYLTDLQVQRNIEPERKVEFRQLGQPEGGMVNSGASRVVAALAFVGVMGVWIFLVLVIAGVGEGLRANAAARNSAAAGPHPVDYAAAPSGAPPHQPVESRYELERRERVG